MKKLSIIICTMTTLFSAFAFTACRKQNNPDAGDTGNDIPAEEEAVIPYAEDFTCVYRSKDGETYSSRNRLFGGTGEVYVQIGFTLSAGAYGAGKKTLTIKPVLSDGFVGSIVGANTSAVNNAELTASYDADDKTAKNCTIELKVDFNYYSGALKIGYAYDEEEYATTGSFNLLCGEEFTFTYDAFTNGYFVGIDGSRYRGDNNWLKKRSSLQMPDTFNEKPVTGIESGLFSGCSSLENLALPEEIVTIGKSAFYGCGALKYNETENGRYLGSENNDYLCLMGVKSKNFKKFSVNEDCRVIYDYAFSGCSSLFDITLPDGITRIGANVFSGCSALMRVYVPESIQSADTDAFSGCDNLEYQKYTGSSFVGNISKGRKYTVLVKGVQTGRIRLRLGERCVIADEAFAGSRIITFEHYIEDGDLIIGNGAFKNCKGLKDFSLCSGTEAIGNNALEGCAALEIVKLNASLKMIGSNVFKGCDSLQTIVFYGTIEEWLNLSEHIGERADGGKVTVSCSDGEIQFSLY